MTISSIIPVKGLTENFEEDTSFSGLLRLKCLELSDTEVGSSGIRHLSDQMSCRERLSFMNIFFMILYTYIGIARNSFSVTVFVTGLINLESLNLSFTGVTDGGLRKLSGLSSIKSLNLDVRQITDTGLAALTNFKNLRSLEICGGGLTDIGVKNIKDLTSLVLLNLSQNHSLTDKSLESILGLTTSFFERLIFPCNSSWSEASEVT